MSHTQAKPLEQSVPGPSRRSSASEAQEPSQFQPDALSRSHEWAPAPPSASTPSSRRPSVRSEAAAKMRSTLSASSSPVERSSAQFASSAQAPNLRHPGQNGNSLHVPMGNSGPRSPTSPSHFVPSPTAEVYTAAYISQQGSSLTSTSSRADLLAASATAAPTMAALGRMASSPGVAGSNGQAPVNGRMRSQTSGFTNTNGSGMLGTNYQQSARSLRSSPQMRAQMAQAQMAVPSLHGMGAPFHPLPMNGPAYERHTAELTNCIIAFLSPILPTEEEYRIKEATRRQLERLASRVSPGAKLLAFGSMANGFALRNSDMDLCCLIGKKDGQPTTRHSASELVEILGQLIREETDFTVMPLPKARIPIIKIKRVPTPDLPYEISCDIGFENRLALENTRLLLSYAMVDPPRLRTLVLFLKVWTKRRKLNSPYMGTLSSYGYTLLALFFLTHVKRPPVLPNLQRVPPTGPLAPEEIELNGNNIYFYDDVATLRKEWNSQNTENVGELLIDFFRYFSKDFCYAKEVISIRMEGGLLSKDSKSWNAELCIEDPFQMGYNVSRTVTKDGLYTIRGEFMRASRILVNPRSQRVSALIAELCEEREDSLSRAPDLPSPRPKYNNGLDLRAYRDMYSNPRRYDAPSYSGYGGSFAFEQMARGLGQGIAFPPSTAMLAPLSRTHGLSPKPQPPRFAAQHDAMMSSGQSETGTVSAYDYMRASFGHASARTSPSFKHALSNGLQSGSGAQEAFAYGAAISFGPDTPSATRDDMGGPRNKTARSLSESLNRSKSLPRPGPMNGDTSAAAAAAAYAALQTSPNLEPGLTVQQGDRRMSSSSHTSSDWAYPQCRGSHADTHALVQEYLRRASLQDPDYPPVEDDACSVISEGTLDELARVSELDLADSPKPQPRSSVSFIQQAKIRREAAAAREKA